jgi:tellurite resistance protein
MNEDFEIRRVALDTALAIAKIYGQSDADELVAAAKVIENYLRGKG